eukprot:8319783-Pyramimonas_sp.AAC.1
MKKPVRHVRRIARRSLKGTKARVEVKAKVLAEAAGQTSCKGKGRRGNPKGAIGQTTLSTRVPPR